MRSVHPTWLTVLSDPLRLTILRLLHQLGPSDVRVLAVQAHSSSRTLRRHLDALIAVRIVHEVGSAGDGFTPGRPASRFILDPRVREDLGDLFRILSRPLGS